MALTAQERLDRAFATVLANAAEALAMARYYPDSPIARGDLDYSIKEIEEFLNVNASA